MLLTFDMPIPFNSIGRRNVSNVPAQALILMNDPFVVGQTELWAKRLCAAESKVFAQIEGDRISACVRLTPIESAVCVEVQAREHFPYGLGLYLQSPAYDLPINVDPTARAGHGVHSLGAGAQR